jgi:RsiW-degrading membrane proteinase PrsW (M82 family)
LTIPIAALAVPMQNPGMVFPPQLALAALVVSLLALVMIGSVLLARSPRAERPFLCLLILLMLPMNLLAFHALRLPLDSALLGLLGEHSPALRVLRMFYAPLTEEPAKLWLFLLPGFYRRLTSENLVRVALALGLGFGIGEAWTVAGLLARSPDIAALPWHALGGYIGERLMVCVMHASFSASALCLIVRHKRVVIGVASAMLLHFLANLPLGFVNPRSPTGQILLSLWVLFCFLGGTGLLAYLAYGKTWFRTLMRGRVTCPECGTPYEHPWFGVNLLHKRYEKCPHCRKWHLVSAFSEFDEKS